MIRPRQSGLSRAFDPFSDDFFSFPSLFNFDSARFAPRVDVSETDEKLAFTFELPGMKQEDIKVTVKNDTLTVSGKREERREGKSEQYAHREISSGSFCRSFSLPGTVKTDSIKAEYRNGLLEISLDKLEEVKPREIEVKVK